MIGKKKSSRAIIVKNNKVLLMHRIKKNKRDNYTLIGGSIEHNETPNDAVIREVKEETNLDIIKKEFLFEFEDNKRYAYYYLIREFEGKPELCGPEREKNTIDNQYILEWISFDRLYEISFFDDEIELRNKIFEIILSLKK